MPIKDYKCKVGANESIAQIQQELLEHGATGFAMQYEKGTGRIQSLRFILDMGGIELPFMLPIDWRAFQVVLKAQRVTSWKNEDYCYRVAWRNIFHWIESQMAMLETKMVTMPQIFLPYMVDRKGKTAFQYFADKPQLFLE